MLKLIKNIFRTKAAAPAQEPTLLELFELYKLHAFPKIQAGKDGNLRISPKEIWLNISENCNLKCVGCYTEDKFKKVYSDVEDVRKAIDVAGEIEQISFTTNEALLNPNFCDIIDLCRERHPNAKLWIITNGTIPIKGRYKQAISKLNKVGLSIDGATKETYEKIRIGANFEDFLKNTKDIIQIREETGSPAEITFGFTATATNLHELKDLVRLAHEMGVNNVWAQSMQANGEIIEARIADILIGTLDPGVRTALINDAIEEAKLLGIGLYYSEGLFPPKNEPVVAVDAQARSIELKMCQYPWTQPAQISRYEDKFLVRPCCYIPTTKLKNLAVKHNMIFQELVSADVIYNSEQMWKFRERLINGDTMDVCGKCDAARGFQWKPETV
jgi:MoaA/NifB/PqqE/SkfB family radical SAM enzyme